MRECFPCPNLRGTFVWEAESFLSVPFYVVILNVQYIYMFCAKWESVQFQNCPAQSGNSHFVGRSKNSYFAQCNSGIARAQSGNRDKVRIRVIALVSSLLTILNRG